MGGIRGGDYINLFYMVLFIGIIIGLVIVKIYLSDDVDFTVYFKGYKKFLLGVDVTSEETVYSRQITLTVGLVFLFISMRFVTYRT